MNESRNDYVKATFINLDFVLFSYLLYTNDIKSLQFIWLFKTELLNCDEFDDD